MPESNLDHNCICSSEHLRQDEATNDLDAYTYTLPFELIAQEPLPVRHSSRLAHLRRDINTIAHCSFSNLPDLLRAGDLLVVNDTKVIPARLWARRASGGLVELLLLRPESSGLWQSMATPLRKLKTGEILTVESPGDNVHNITIAAIFSSEDGQRRLLVDLGAPEKVFSLLSGHGFAPLPPYIQRDSNTVKRSEDLDRYQTVFANAPGAVAAPTAGLHFSEEVIAQLNSRHIEVCSITLHVGPGTFKPITTSVAEHIIEPEIFSIPRRTADLVNCALSQKRRVIAVGTTSCRALETAGADGHLISTGSQSTSLYIKPGYKFRVLSGLITNFHLSRSSLLVLVSTFAGYELTMRAYNEAIAQRYRFYSYGDAMLIT